MRESTAQPSILPLEREDAVLTIPEILAPAPRHRRLGLARRERVPETMDDPNLDEADHRWALRGLARLNRISFSVRHVWRPIHRLAKQEGLKKLTVMDVATGGGDVPIALSRVARRAGLELSVVGVDVSDQALDFAKSQAAAQGEPIEFVRADVLADGLPRPCDVAICSLFLHHLSDVEANRLLQAMNQSATRLCVVNDLARSLATYAQVWAASRIVSRSPIVHYDGPASVRAAFTIDEALSLASGAGVKDAEARRAFPCRYVMTWSPAL